MTLDADPFYGVQLATSTLDEMRRRVQNETLGHRGHNDDPSTESDASSPRPKNV